MARAGRGVTLMARRVVATAPARLTLAMDLLMLLFDDDEALPTVIEVAERTDIAIAIAPEINVL